MQRSVFVVTIRVAENQTYKRPDAQKPEAADTLRVDAYVTRLRVGLVFIAKLLVSYARRNRPFVPISKTCDMNATPCWLTRGLTQMAVVAAVLAMAPQAVSRAAETPISYDRDVRPIFARHCFTCHGPDEAAREASLRLDVEHGTDGDAAAHDDLGGYRAVEPGDAAASEVIRRVTSDDEFMRMPPDSPRLSEAEIQTLRQWIDQGGAYSKHWAFVPPTAVAVPAVLGKQETVPEQHAAMDHWIDAFLVDRMNQSGLQQGEAADRVTMIRRLYLDLLGITPTPEEVQRQLADDSPMARTRLIDRLLARPEYAERFARPWLDLARYADTNGYEKDRSRTIWPFRDWVIDAIAADMPFDQFSIQQLAGDMLPPVPGDPLATQQQKIASGFHRNTMLNEEGGIDPMEYRFHAVVDRVATTGTVWMGLTTGCAQCHTHKYDPITHTDYYALFALLNQADEPELEVLDKATRRRRDKIQSQMDIETDRLVTEHLPTLAQWQESAAPVAEASAADEPTSAAETSPAEAQTPAADEDTAKSDPSADPAATFTDWIASLREDVRVWQRLRPVALESTLPLLSVLPDDSILASGDVSKRDVYELEFDLGPHHVGATALRLEVMPHPSLPAGGPGMTYYEGRRGDFFLSELTASLDGRSLRLVDPSHSYGKISVGSGSAEAGNVIDGEGSTGWSIADAPEPAQHWVVQLQSPIQTPGKLSIELLFERHFAASLGHFRLSLTTDPRGASAMSIPAQLQRELTDGDLTRSDERAKALYERLGNHFVTHHDSMKPHRQRWSQLRDSLPEPPRTLVMRQRPPESARVTHRHHRGEYLQPKEVVQPAIPKVLGELPSDAPANRLTLARWLVSDENPLVARVVVNRAWREFFGSGIVRTAGDYGTQSQPPTHPHLLDTLAVDLMDHGWSMKRLHRQIVRSASYGRAMGKPPAADPENKLLSRFPYRRLDAERIRDVMLSAAGVMDTRVGGPSVFPPQPAGVWAMAYGSPQWQVSSGGDRYRRSLYTFAKRTAPFAAYATFDAPTGEQCLARRPVSTTPLQALTLMNDSMFVELAEQLAESVRRDLPADVSDHQLAAAMFRRILVRSPTQTELNAIVEYVQAVGGSTANDAPSTADSPATDGVQTLGRWTLVARALMNLDETVCVP